jgi:hypothetical protein
MYGVLDAQRYVRQQVRRLVREPAVDAVERVRRRWRSALIRTVRLTGAAALGYAVAAAALSDPRPLTAALTALLIVQVTLLGTIADSIRRILAVVLGVTLAIALSEFVPFSVWSLSAVIAVSILLGLLMRLGPHLLEVPISAMLVLGVGGAHAAATSRISETLVGTAAGLVLTLVLPPAVQNRTAGAAVEGFAIEMAELLERVAGDLNRPLSVEQAQRWLAEARRVTHHIPAVERALQDAEQSRRMNARAVGLTETGEGLQTGLDSLEHSAVALRGLYRALADGLRAAGDGPEAGIYDRDVRSVFAVLLLDLAAAVRGFGAFVRGEADDVPVRHPAELEDSIESVRELRARLTDLLLVDPRTDQNLWELHGAMLTSIERVLIEIDLERRLRERDRRLESVEENRTATSAAVARLRVATRQAAERRPRMPPRARSRRGR